MKLLREPNANQIDDNSVGRFLNAKIILLDNTFHRMCCVRNFGKFTGKHPSACSFIKNETLSQVFSSEFCEISESTFYAEHL